MPVKKIIISLLMVFSFLCVTNTTSATVIDLYQLATNIDGVYTKSALAPNPADISGWTIIPPSDSNDTKDLGILTWTTTEDKSHHFTAWFDYDIDENDTGWTNETGAAVGTASTNQKWEIDEPDYVFGNIVAHVKDSAVPLDEKIFGSYPNTQNTEDVSFAMEWNFDWQDEYLSATIEMILSEVAPDSGFYLVQTDVLTNAKIFLSSTLTFTEKDPGGEPVPEPSTMLLFGLGILGLAKFSRKRL